MAEDVGVGEGVGGEEEIGGNDALAEWEGGDEGGDGGDEVGVGEGGDFGFGFGVCGLPDGDDVAELIAGLIGWEGSGGD